MTPFATWTFFGLLLLYAVLPILALGIAQTRLSRVAAMAGVVLAVPFVATVAGALVFPTQGEGVTTQFFEQLGAAWPFSLFLLVVAAFGNASARWCFILTLPILAFVFAHHDNTVLRIAGAHLPEAGGEVLTRPWSKTTTGVEFSPLYLFLLCVAWQLWVPFVFLRWKSNRTFYIAMLLTLLPLTANRLLPFVSHESVFGYLGISYVTFRALDVIFSIRDGVVKSLAPGQLFAFLFFIPTVSSGPIDRYRRFGQDWVKSRTRAEFLGDLDFAIQRVVRGFLYKFIIAAEIDTHLRVPLLKVAGFWGYAGYMYVYTFYLFFDFAGYTAFAVGVSRLLGIKSPENFSLPFLARNIKEFWTRWHISLSFWFRDHIYMRFQLAAMKGKWFKGKNTASYLGLFLTFGLMGVWHGLAFYYILYGIYHAVLLCGYDMFARWNKQAKVWGDGPWWRALNIGLTFHVIALGMLLFSGRLTPPPPPPFEALFEEADHVAASGYVWQKDKPGVAVIVDVYVDHAWTARSKCDVPRPDLRARGYGDGVIGFRVELPAWLRDGKTHAIEVHIAEDYRLVGKSKSIVFPNELPPIPPGAAAPPGAPPPVPAPPNL
jgi:membrane protein involved in D-alanine export